MRIVVKVGTSTLAHPTGRLNIRHVEELVKVLSDLKNAGHEVVLVSSGAGKDCGLSEEKALLYGAKMLEGAARLALESHKDPAALRQAVCSPGGATIQGVHALERGNFRDVTMEAVKAAYKRTLELK